MMMTLITPIHPKKMDFLNKCIDSVCLFRDALKDSAIKVEWIVVFDGPVSIEIPDFKNQADKILYLDENKGISFARNKGLENAIGDWIFPLDADDVINAAKSGFVNFSEKLLEVDDSIGFVGGNRLLISGEKTPHWNDIEHSFEVGELAETWSSPFLFHCNSIVIRKEALLNVGGWPDYTVNEDLALILFLNEKYKGLFFTDVIEFYRVWGKQMVSSDFYVNKKADMFRDIENAINRSRESLGVKKLIKRPSSGSAFGILKKE